MKKHVFLCDTESTLNGIPTHVYVWSDTIPTECPNNSGHTIDTSSINIIETRNADRNLPIIPKTTVINNSGYIRIATEIFSGSQYATAKSISYMDSSVTSYDIQIYDKYNKQILLTKNLTNTQEGLQDLGVLSNLPLSSTQLEISVKRNGGNAASNIYIQSVTIYYN